MAADRSFCMPACFPRKNEAIVPGWVSRSVGDALPFSEVRAVAGCNLGVHDIRSEEDWEFGRLVVWVGFAIYHPVSGGEGGLRIYKHQRGLGAQPQPLTTTTSVLSDGSYAGAGIPRLPPNNKKCYTLFLLL